MREWDSWPYRDWYAWPDRPWLPLPGNVPHRRKCPAHYQRYGYSKGVTTAECQCGFWERLQAWGAATGISTTCFIPRSNFGGDTVNVDSDKASLKDWDSTLDVPTLTAYTEVSLQEQASDRGMFEYIGIAFDPVFADRLCVWIDENLQE